MNPMPVVMYLMGVDAAHELLEGLGFVKKPHPEGVGSSLYLREEALLHSTGLWYRGVLYHRPKERFYRTLLPPYPPQVHPEAKPLSFAQGLAHFLPFLQDYEARVAALRGEGRGRFLRRLPSGARRYLKDWRSFFAEEGRGECP